MELEPHVLLKRYCFLGSFEPFRVYLKAPVNIPAFYDKILPLCTIADPESFKTILKGVILESAPARLDETFFVLATYLTSTVKEEWKNSVRQSFPTLITSDMNLFLFCKIAADVLKHLGRKPFNKTIRKAITEWYEARSVEDLNDMWITQAGAYGFTHNQLIKMCHMGAKSIPKQAEIPFFQTCTEMLKSSQNDGDAPTPDPAAAVDGVNNALANGVTAVTVSSKILDICKLRTTNNISLASNTISSRKLRIRQVPSRFLRSASIVKQLIPDMTCAQLAEYWFRFTRYEHLKDPEIIALIKSLINDPAALKDIQPVMCLQQLNIIDATQQSSDMKYNRYRSVFRKNNVHLPLLKQMYFNSFEHKESTKLRIHITMNLHQSHKKKCLPNMRYITFFNACVSVAFSYFKTASQADVFYWSQYTSKLNPIEWNQNMSIKNALAIAETIHIEKNWQDLSLPIKEAEKSDKVYDLFLVIVATAARGNKGRSSNDLTAKLDEYRYLESRYLNSSEQFSEKKNIKVKKSGYCGVSGIGGTMLLPRGRDLFVNSINIYCILDLCRLKPSMFYSKQKVENILEICGLDEHSANYIHDFATNHFD